MKKILCIFFLFSLHAQEHHHHPRPIHPSYEMNDIHLHIDVPERPNAPEPHTPQDIKKLKIKVAAFTAIVTALITGGVAIYLGVHNCK